MHNLKIFVFCFVALLLSILIVQSVSNNCVFCAKQNATSCTKEDFEYAEFWGYYDPIEAYNFGLEVQKIFKSKNKEKLLNLIGFELSNGPRKKLIIENDFQDIFPKKLIKKITQSDVPCSPNGWRGFTIGNGLVWYNLNNDNNWNIFSINGANIEEVYSEEPFWQIKGKIIHPSCFNKPLISGDNFEEFADKYYIQDIQKFFERPGVFYGNKIKNFPKFIPSWCSNDNNCEKISIGNKISECPEISFYEDSEINIWEFHSLNKTTKGIYQIDKKAHNNEEYYYSNLANLRTDVCELLAPDFGEKCSRASLIEVADYSGGSFGWHFTYAIYGLYNLSEGGDTILPLMFFSSKNESLNFIEKLSHKKINENFQN